ncbi:hypothetical protein HZC33_02750 [Candidatus Wolfebacteria bacterium]|nr:hypothetical protein [Candidatus Wolfebacteria bacterium]
MLTITKQQVLKRWDDLPMILREAIFSERNADILWGICEAQHLSKEKIRKISILAGDVIMGLTHQDDLAKEIRNETGINSEIVSLIVDEMDRKIFSLIKSEIEKAFALAWPSEEIEENLEVGIEAGKPIVSDIIKQEIKITRPKPSSAEPLKIITTEEGEKIILPKAGIEEVPQVAPAPVSVAEGPVVLHKEEEAVKPIFGEKKSLGDLFGHLLGKKPFEGIEKKDVVSVAAQMEIPKQVEIKESQPALIAEQEKVREVHYENVLRTPITQAGEPMPVSLSPVEQQIKPAVVEEKKSEPIAEVVKEKQLSEEEKAKAKVVNFKVEENKPEEKLIAPAKKNIFGFVKNLFKNKNKEVVNKQEIAVAPMAESAIMPEIAPIKKEEIKESVAITSDSNREKIENAGAVKEETKVTEETNPIEESKQIEEVGQIEKTKRKIDIKGFIKSLFNK